jgi:hypothetical protein
MARPDPGDFSLLLTNIDKTFIFLVVNVTGQKRLGRASLDNWRAFH